jgi:uncharacterized cupredoxin-like copper-binding protein
MRALAARRLVVAFAIIGGGVVAHTGVGFGTASASMKAFCRLNVAGETGLDFSGLYDLRATAPEQIADTVDFVVTQILESGPPAGGDPALVAARAEIDQFVVDECGYQSVEVAMADYGFDGVPARLKKGVVAFSLHNEGAEFHEFQLVRLKRGLTVEDVLSADALGQPKQAAPLLPVEAIPGVGAAFPGQSDVVVVDFKKPGTYLAFCAIAVGTTPEAMAARGEPILPATAGTAYGKRGAYFSHYDEGMAVQFTVN